MAVKLRIQHSFYIIILFPGRNLSPQSSPSTPSSGLQLPPDSPPFDPLPTPATPPSLSIGPKKAIKSTPVKEKDKEKDGKDSVIKEKESKDKIEKDGKEVGIKEELNLNATSIASVTAKEKDVISRKDKVAEAHRLRAAASVELESADPSSLKSSPDSWSPKTLPLTGKIPGDEPDMKRPMPALTKDPNSSSSVSVSTSKMSVSPTGSLGPSLTMAPGMIQSQTRSTNGKIQREWSFC